MSGAIASPLGTFADRLRAARTALDMSVQQLADRCDGVTVDVVRRWERGRTEPAGKQRALVARALNVPYHKLFVPEEVADKLNPIERTLLLSARRVVRGGERRYVDVTFPVQRRAVDTLVQLWLVEHKSQLYGGTLDGDRYVLTGPGDDVLHVEQLRRGSK
jgi:transcriptional regulator with XRE-family HTH domain